MGNVRTLPGVENDETSEIDPEYAKILSTLCALVTQAVAQGQKYAICVEAESRSTVLASSFGDALETARFLERFARAQRRGVAG